MFTEHKKIHFIGIGGIGISALAKWAYLESVKVSGSDICQNEATRELEDLGIRVSIGHKKENLPKDADLIIYSFAVSKNNPERRNKIKQLSYFEALGEATKTKRVVAVSGTNGKSTTTAMLGKILIDAGLDPTVIVGSRIKDFRYGNFHYGKSDLLVLEACEHNAHMLLLHPQIITLTNIEEDHLDFYKNLKNILAIFKKYISKLPKTGKLIYNNDDKNTKKIIGGRVVSNLSYGLDGADIYFKERHIKNSRQYFTVGGRVVSSVVVELKVPGLYNVYNALAATSTASVLGVSLEVAKKSLADFNGLWRRFELVGKYKGAPVISDYGHHPTAVAGCLLAAREFYPERRIVLAFEPHQHHRTKALFADFVRSFDDADVVILSEIYNVEGRVALSDRDISSKSLAEAIKRYWESSEMGVRERKIFYSANLSETEAILKQEIKRGDVVLIMGAGDVYKVAERLCRVSNF